MTTDAWAVGFTKTVGAAGRFPLAVHWNGSAWSLVVSPSPASNDTLAGVATRSAGDVWAVGSSSVTAHTLALRETG